MDKFAKFMSALGTWMQANSVAAAYVTFVLGVVALIAFLVLVVT